MTSRLPAGDEVARIALPPDALVYPEGWQSWTPTDFYGVGDAQRRPVDQRQFQLGYRADRPWPSGVPGEFVADGLLAFVDPTAGVAHVFSASAPQRPVRLTAAYRDGVCVVGADGDVAYAEVGLGGAAAATDFAMGGSGAGEPATAPAAGVSDPVAAGQSELAAWASGRGWASPARPARPAARPGNPAPTVWCSWYQYFTDLTQADVLENLAAMDELGLDFDVVQIDDGYEREIGDWREPSREFPDVHGLIAAIRERGRRAGIWMAPWLVGERSQLAAQHPEWLLRDAGGELVSAGFNWGQRLWVLDTTHAEASAHLRAVMGEFVAAGVDFFKLDFLYAGALPGVRADGSEPVAAYRRFLSDMGQWFPEAYVLACGAPMWPSVGLVDAMRVSPDTAPHRQPSGDDWSAPGQLSAMLTGGARQWQNGVFWTNDPDCLLARPGVESREEWAAYLAGYRGLRACSDRLRSLDSEGLSYTLKHLECATI